MSAVGQTAALRNIFRRIYTHIRPHRVAVLGCTAGGDFRDIQPEITAVAVGVDVNPAYIEAGRQRSSGFVGAVQWVCGDVLSVELPEVPFDLVHAALLLEYVDADQLFLRVRKWLRPGGLFSVVTQEPTKNLPAVSSTPYRSLQKLGGTMHLRRVDEIVAIAAATGYVAVKKSLVELANGKVLAHSVYKLTAAAELDVSADKA